MYLIMKLKKGLCMSSISSTVLVTKVNNNDASGFALKTKYDTDKSDLEKKIEILVGLLKKKIILLKLVK